MFKELLFYMEQDKCGMQTISSLYYDTDDFQLIQQSIEKPIYREKFKILSYGIPEPTDTLFLHLKKKSNSLRLQKTRAFIFRKGHYL
ncbi:MAG: VTC domain-containing protein [Carnobacterium maltaromaticum]